jgi:hypothetical protein
MHDTGRVRNPIKYEHSTKRYTEGGIDTDGGKLDALGPSHANILQLRHRLILEPAGEKGNSGCARKRGDLGRRRSILHRLLD